MQNEKEFEMCHHCGDVFFATDGQQTKRGFLCRVCKDKGVR